MDENVKVWIQIVAFEQSKLYLEQSTIFIRPNLWPGMSTQCFIPCNENRHIYRLCLGIFDDIHILCRDCGGFHISRFCYTNLLDFASAPVVRGIWIARFRLRLRSSRIKGMVWKVWVLISTHNWLVQERAHQSLALPRLIKTISIKSVHDLAIEGHAKLLQEEPGIFITIGCSVDGDVHALARHVSTGQINEKSILSLPG